MKRRRSRREQGSAILDETMPLAIPATEEQTPPERNVWRRLRLVLVTFAAFLFMLILSVAIGSYAGYRQGELDRVATRVAAAEEHYQQGITRLDAGEYELAIAEFEYALQLDPDHALASQGLAEAEARLAARPTPTSQAEEDIVGDLYAQGTAAYEEQDWETAIQSLSQLRVFDPQYEQAAVEEMLFDSLYRQGLALLEEDRFEEGIFHLDQALEIRPLDEDTLWQRDMAQRYLTALGYWGVNWQRCIEKFEELYGLAPGYKDVFSRLYEARTLYGDLWADQGEMCPAAEQYEQALQLANDPELQEQYTEAEQICAIATPTPIAPLTDTLAITGTVTVPGFTVGRLAYPAYNPQTGQYEVFAVTSDGTNGLLTRVATGADQPAWQWGSSRLAYRNRVSGGLSVFQPGSPTGALQASSGAAWPALSPDGSRYVYAAPDGAGVWHIYIGRTDGASEPVVHAPGWGPAWSPAGLLAWTGCEADGSACGIFADNPDDGQPPTRLTASIDDGGLHWASGDSLVYMSDHSGSWDLYLLNTSGGVQVLTDDTSIEALPAWAPDGSAVAFLSYRDSRWGLYLVQPNGENLRKIVDLGPEMPGWQNQRLSWAP